MRNPSPTPLIAPAPPLSGRAITIGLATLLVIVTAAVYSPVVRCQFLMWDDIDNLALNPQFNPVTPATVTHYLSHAERTMYDPLTLAVWAGVAAIAPRQPADENGITLNPAVFHGFNAAMHCAGAVLGFWVLRRLVGKDLPAFCGALAFALHPVMVEPVAWMSGAKDVLCGGLCLAAIGQYIAFTDAMTRSRARKHYITAAGLFVLAMLAKPAAVSLPIVVGVIDVLLLRLDVRRAVRSLWPWLVLTLPIIAIGKIVQPATLTERVPIYLRPFVAGDAIAFYLAKLAWPAMLIVDYGRHPEWLLGRGPLMYLTTFATVALLAGAWALRRRFPFVLAGLGILIGATLPVLGFVPFDFQRYSTVADHYLYLAMLGPALIVASALRRAARPWAYAVCGVVLVAYAARTYTQIGYWRDMPTLWQHVLEGNPQSPTGYRVAAYSLLNQGRLPEAIEQYEKALRARPSDQETRYNFANALMRVGRLEDAAAQFRIVTDAVPDDPKAPNNLGSVLARLQRFDPAEAALREAIRRDESYAEAHQNLGLVSAMTGRLDAAAAEFHATLALDPGNAIAKRSLEKIRAMQGTPTPR